MHQSFQILNEIRHLAWDLGYGFDLKLSEITGILTIIGSFVFTILFYFGFLMFEEAFTKNYSTGTVWDPPLWVPYSSMMIGAALMILQYIAEIIKLTDEKDTN